MTNTTPVQIPPEQEMTITLQAQHWQVILNAINELPYRLANPIMQTLTQQFSARLAGPSPTSNGRDYDAAPE